MARILIPLVLVAAAIGAYFVFFHEGPAPDDTNPELQGDAGAGKSEKPKKDLSSGKKDTTLETRPTIPANAQPETGKLKVTANVLMVAKLPGQWQSLMEIVFDAVEDLGYRTWYMQDPKSKEGRAGRGRGMAELKSQPTAAYLKDHDVRALFLDGVDPNAFPEAFWTVVSDRVRTGKMGLWFRPGFPSTGQRANTQHPALSHPVLSALLPVARVALLEGDAVPGIYAEPQRLKVADAGTQHLATRLVGNPEASARIWQSASMDEGVFATKFCYPVLEIKPAAKALVNVDAATSVPALIAASTEVGRVLWMGNIDFGHKTYFNSRSNALQQLVFNHQIIWLVGQAEGE